MSEKTSVLLITGFLGSGKTTFLNRVINSFPEEYKLTILMNEFGEIGIDGTLVEGEDVDMLEISRGSIFCVCVKTDFIKGLYELNSTIKPDLLIIESTGVANPSDLKRDLRLPIFNNRFEFAEQFCIIDAVNFFEAFEVFASVEKQLSTSTVFIINKTDLVSDEVIGKIKELVSKHHPDPRFFETTYAKFPFDEIESLGIIKGATEPPADPPPAVLTTQELDDFILKSLENPGLDSTPPDQLVSVTYAWHGTQLNDIEMMAGTIPDGVVRAKGFVEVAGAISLFSYVMGNWTIEPSDKDIEDIKHRNMIVFIGGFEAIDKLDIVIDSKNWSAREILQPFGQISSL